MRMLTYHDVLSEEERARYSRFRQERSRLMFIVAHGLKRRTLSWCIPDITPSRWKFELNGDGRTRLPP